MTKICPVDRSRPCTCHRRPAQCPRRSPNYRPDAITRGLDDASMGVAYEPGSPGEVAYMAAYAVLRCCNLIGAGDGRVPERIGRIVQEMTKGEEGPACSLCNAPFGQPHTDECNRRMGQYVG